MVGITGFGWKCGKQGRNASGVDGTTQARAPGIGRGVPFEDPSKIRDNRPRAASHRASEYTVIAVQIPLLARRAQDPVALQGNLRAGLSLITCCGTFSFTVYHSYVGCKLLGGRLRSEWGKRGALPSGRGESEQGVLDEDLSCTGVIPAKPAAPRVDGTCEMDGNGVRIRDSPRLGRNETPAAGCLARGAGKRRQDGALRPCPRGWPLVLDRKRLAAWPESLSTGPHPSC